MWRGWRGDVRAVAVGLALFPVLLYALGSAVAAYEVRFCDEVCEVDGGWQLPGF